MTDSGSRASTYHRPDRYNGRNWAGKAEVPSEFVQVTHGVSDKEETGGRGLRDAAKKSKSWSESADSTPESIADSPRTTPRRHSATPDSTYHSPGAYFGESGAGGEPPAHVADMGGGSALEQQRRIAGRRPIGSDDEGGPGDSAASVAWLARERAEKVAGARNATRTPGPATRAAPAATRAAPAPATPPAPAAALARPEPHSSVARVQPQAAIPQETRRGSTKNLPDWERWLAFCARIDGFPRHLSIHTGGMLITAAPLIDIAPLERATMPGRVVVQFDKRDVETIKLIKLDLLGLGMLAAIDETLQLIESDLAACVDLDRIPEDIPEVFEMLCAADTVGVFQVESRAQMQTLPKSRPQTLDDLVVEVAIIRPGPIQGNAVHPYLRRRQGLEPTTFLHPSLAPVLRETLGVILYQEQVMQIAITVAGFSAGESDGFRRAMGTWRSSAEMEKLHERFVTGCKTTNNLTDEQAEELFRQLAAFASFGFAKSHAAAFARTAYESAFLKRHGVAVLPVDVNHSTYKTTTEWVGPGRQRPIRSSGCIVPSPESRHHWTPDSATGYAIRLGLHLVKGIGEEQAERLDAELDRGPYASLADVVARTGLSEEVVERLIRAGALDSLGRPRRELLWQLREVASATTPAGRPPDRRTSARTGVRTPGGSVGSDRSPSVQGSVRGATPARPAPDQAWGRSSGQLDLRLPPTDVPALPPITERERLGDSYAILNLDPQRQVVSLFRPALEKLGAVTNASLADRASGPVRLGGLVVTRQHPMTARGTVFLALEDETGMVNVTLWPDAWARLRGVIRRHALLYVDGMLQREANVVNVIAREVRSLSEVAEAIGGPVKPDGVRALGYSGMRRG